MLRIIFFCLVIITLFIGKITAQEAENIELVGGIYNALLGLNDIEVVDDLVYIAAGNSGLQIFDVSDPESPVVISYVNIDSLGPAYSVSVSGEYVYLVRRMGGLRVISVSDPENPHEVGHCETPGHAYDVAVSDGYAYIADGIWFGLRVVDIMDPENPVEVGNYDTPGSEMDVSVSGDFAYVACGEDGLYVISLSDPENPEEVGYYETEDRAYSTDIYDNYLYVADGSGGLRVFLISDPEDLEEVGCYESDESIVDISISGGYAYLGEWKQNAPAEDVTGGGLRILSMDDPENPEEIGYHDPPGRSTRSISVDGDFVYLVSGSFRIISIEDLENLREVYCLDRNISANSISVSGDYAYVTNHDLGLRIISIDDPENLTEVGYCPTSGRSRDIKVYGDYAYIADGMGRGLRVISVVDPRDPQQMGECEEDAGRFWDVEVSGDYAYTISLGMSVISIADPNNTEVVGNFDVDHHWQFVHGVAISGDFAYLAASSGFIVVSIADPENPEEVGYCMAPLGRAVAISGEYAYEVGDHGFRVISVDDPEDPYIVGSCNAVPASNDIVLSGNYAYVTANQSGLYVVSIENPRQPERVGYYRTQGSPYSVDLSEDGLIYVADFTNVGVYRFWENGFIPSIDVSLDTLNFEMVEIDSSLTLSLTIMSVGHEDLTIEYIALQGDHFSAELDSMFVLESGSTHDVSVTFTPDEVGNFEGTLMIISDDPLNEFLTVELFGIGPNTVSNDLNSVPTEFRITAVHPNPFNGQFSFEIQLPQADLVHLNLYDITGRQVWSLWDRLGVGVHCQSVDLKLNSAGVYFLQAESSIGSDIQRVVMLK